jgi:4-diphosphocytidyl-2-C-methyl-D-erythritol kinase
MSTTIRSFSKINLGLAIGPSRADGFHALATCYQTLDAHDLVTVDARPAPASSIRVTSNNDRIPTNNRNTVWKIVELALEAMGRTAQVHIHIDKHLPVQGGLGAGSANAVAALIALETELIRHNVPLLAAEEKLRITTAVGSDVPLFLIGGAVLGTGRGEEVSPLPDFPATDCVLALPDVGVSTPQAFRDWDVMHTQPSGPAPGLSLDPELTTPPGSDKLMTLSRVLCSAFAPSQGTHSSGVSVLDGGLAETTGSSAGLPDGVLNPLLALVRTGIENDFEEVVFRQYPHLGNIKRILAASDCSEESALIAALSGSGSALFGLYGTPEAATAAETRLNAAGIRSLRTKTLPRDAYWGTMVGPTATNC